MSKAVRIAIATITFMCVMTINGIPTREAHQFIYVLGIMAIFGIVLDNLWVSLMLWWTIFLFSYGKFNTGWVYISNVFYGCLLYYITKKSFKKEYIGWYINIVLWLLILNIFYGCIQVLNLDFFFEGGIIGSHGGEALRGFFTQGGLQGAPIGFMANTSVMATLIVLCIPLLMSKRTLWAYIATAMLIIPLYCLHSFSCLLTGLIVALFMMFFILPRKIWLIITVLGIISFICLFRFVDLPGIERLSLWRVAMIDARQHPIVGWGLDSFRNVLANKPFTYNMGLVNTGGKIVTNYWDNPHNLYVSVAYEFGFVGLIILGGYIRKMCACFNQAVKDKETLALFGFFISFFIISIGQFPLFLSRLAIFIIPCFALAEISMRKEYQNG